MALTQVKTAGLADDAVTGAKIADDTVAEANMANDAISLTELKAGTDGQIISWDASGNPVAIGPGTDGQVLTSTGSGSPPAFEAVPAGGATINNATANELVTVASTTTQLDAEANLTFDGSTLQVTGDIQGAGNDGTANNLKWDQSDDTLYFRDDVKAQFGTGGDLHIYHDATNSWIVNKTGNLNIYAKHGEYGMRILPDANVELYFDNNKKLETTNTGISVTGAVTPSSGIYIGGSGGGNHLDDYEEGTWTPVFYYYDGGWQTSNVTTAGGTEAYYVKCGNIIHFYLKRTGFEHDSGGDHYAKITGLPFSTGEKGFAVVTYSQAFTANNEDATALISAGGIEFYRGTSWLLWSTSSNRQLYLSGSYEGNT